MRTHRILVVACLAGLGAAAAAHAQNFNIDMSDTASPEAPAPGIAYGAAAGQAGFWNNRQTPLGTTPLNDLNNLPTGVTLNLDGGGMGSFNGPNSAATAAGTNGERLLDDGWDPGTVADVNGNVGVITIAGLAPGDYTIYLYGIAPDSIAFRTGFTVVGGAPGGPVDVGGALGAANSFADTYSVPVTHAVFTKTIGLGENLIVNVTLPNIGGTNFATVNGIQITPEPASLGLLAMGALALIKRRR